MGTELLLVVQRVVTKTDIEVDVWQKILIGLNPTLFYNSLYVDVAASRVFAVYPIALQGSLRDMLHSRQPFTTDKKQERGQIVKPLEVPQLQKLGRKILYIISSCYQYNISLPTLSIGNLILSERHGLVLSDLLMFSCLVLFFLQLCGICVDQQMLHELLTCQGEPFISDSEENEETPRSSCNHIINRLTGLPLPIQNILFYIFHPTIPADLPVLTHHCFFNENEIDSIEASTNNPSPTSTAKMRRKEVELFHRAQDRWKERLEAADEVKTRIETEREHLLQLKQSCNERQTRSKDLSNELSKVETSSIVDDSEICNPPKPTQPQPTAVRGEKEEERVLAPPPPPLPMPSLSVKIKEVAVIGNQFKLSTAAPPTPPLPPMPMPRRM
ncbi:hypothetical protein LSM04_000424 [Trypanosoma melophagium]|uniref:uncharacterized protein n=1 Tax=Trypanosoma melophagium TaxID=715481 RepID=UPI00351A6AA7|nr:hypothetical protein LSM04_000424 [Trypanosoma melophagium]